MNCDIEEECSEDCSTTCDMSDEDFKLTEDMYTTDDSSIVVYGEMDCIVCLTVELNKCSYT